MGDLDDALSEQRGAVKRAGFPGAVAIDVPEAAALLVVAWLVREGEVDEALALSA